MTGQIADKLAEIQSIRERILEHQALANSALEESKRHTDEAVRLQGEAALKMRELMNESGG